MCLRAGQPLQRACVPLVLSRKKEVSSGSVVGEALSVRFSGRVPRRVFWVSALLCSVLGWLVGWLYATLYMTSFPFLFPCGDCTMSAATACGFCRSFSFPYWGLFAGLCSVVSSVNSMKTVTDRIPTLLETISKPLRSPHKGEASGVKNAY